MSESSTPAQRIPRIARMEGFIRDHLCGTLHDMRDYLPGSVTVDLHEGSPSAWRNLRDEKTVPPAAGGRYPHEQDLFEMLCEERAKGVYLLVGTLGAGKTAACQYVMNMIRRGCPKIRKCENCRTSCTRQPLYLDCYKYAYVEDPDPVRVTAEILRALRFEILDEMVREWCLRCGLNTRFINEIMMVNDDRRNVFRALVVANDILPGAGTLQDGIANVVKAAKRLKLGRPLLGTRITEQTVQDFVSKHAGTSRVAALYDAITDYTGNLLSATRFTESVARIYVEKCRRFNPRSLVILDNIDALANPYIEMLVDSLWRMNVPRMPILVAARPSSVSARLYMHEIAKKRHYGPNNFELVLWRLVTCVLSHTNAELIAQINKRTPKQFKGRLSMNDLHVFVFLTYAYAKIMEAGAAMIAEETNEQPLATLSFGEDHSFLKTIRFHEPALRDLATTIRAVCGSSCRYALDMLLRYYQNCYEDPEMIKLFLEGRPFDASEEYPVVIPLRYKLLIGTILFESSNVDARIAELFHREGTKSVALDSLRVLSLLPSHGKKSLLSVVEDMAHYGISADQTVRALNYLHDKRGMLVWFSKNRNLDLDKPEDMNHDIHLSEHGRRYWNTLVGDFEYVWFCASRIYSGQGASNPAREPFATKLTNFIKLVSDIGIISWRQLAFRMSWPEFRQGPSGGELLVLTVSYSSLRKALTSMRYAIASIEPPQREVYKQRMNSLVRGALGLMLEWQRLYSKCFGNGQFAANYKQAFEECEQGFKALEKARYLDDSTKKLHAEYLEDVEVMLGQRRKPDQALEAPLFPMSYPQLPQGLLESMKSSPEQIWIQEYQAAYFERRRSWARYLRDNLPRYEDVLVHVRDLIGMCGNLIGAENHWITSRTPQLQWFHREMKYLSDFEHSLRNCEMLTSAESVRGVPRYCTNEVIENNWASVPKLISLYRDAAIKLELTEPDIRHLGLSWPERRSREDFSLDTSTDFRS